MPLTDAEASEMWQSVFQKGEGKEEIKAGNLPLSRTIVKAVFQKLDDLWESNRLAVKNQLDSVSGVALTNAEAKKLGRAWMKWKWGKE